MYDYLLRERTDVPDDGFTTADKEVLAKLRAEAEAKRKATGRGGSGGDEL